MILRTLTYAVILCQLGCYAATKSTVELTKVEKKMAEAKAAHAHRHAVYAWTMADSYMKKARDEWGHSDYEAAEALMKKAETWANEAIQTARTAPADSQWGTEPVPSQSQETPAPRNASTTPGVW